MAEMRLTQLTVTEDWRNPGSYLGSLQFKGQYGTVEVQLTPELSKRVLELIAEDMVKATKQLAQTLTADILAGAAPTALPSPPDDLEPL